jgi:hypothetical protein
VGLRKYRECKTAKQATQSTAIGATTCASKLKARAKLLRDKRRENRGHAAWPSSNDLGSGDLGMRFFRIENR